MAVINFSNINKTTKMNKETIFYIGFSITIPMIMCKERVKQTSCMNVFTSRTQAQSCNYEWEFGTPSSEFPSFGGVSVRKHGGIITIAASVLQPKVSLSQKSVMCSVH